MNFVYHYYDDELPGYAKKDKVARRTFKGGEQREHEYAIRVAAERRVRIILGWPLADSHSKDATGESARQLKRKRNTRGVRLGVRLGVRAANRSPHLTPVEHFRVSCACLALAIALLPLVLPVTHAWRTAPSRSRFFAGTLDATEIEYAGMGSRRSLESFFEFTKLNFVKVRTAVPVA